MKEFDKVFKDMDKAFKDADAAFKKLDSDTSRIFNQMDNIFKEMDSILAKGTNVARKIELGPWKPWFAWRPVTIKGKRVWMKKIYRRKINTYVDMDDWARYEYGNIFDVIKDAK